jgi:hypothetical protein
MQYNYYLLSELFLSHYCHQAESINARNGLNITFGGMCSCRRIGVACVFAGKLRT